VWCYDPNTNSWSQLECIGYIPLPREGHAAAIVDDVMYVFGGRTEEGADLGDLAAFRITSRRWYTFQNMGPSPSPRSGHSMTTVGKAVVVVGGEPSSAATAVTDLSAVYLLDTSKIRYPTSESQQASQKPQGVRRPSTSDGTPVNAIPRQAPSRDNSLGPSDSKRLTAVREGDSDSPGPMNLSRAASDSNNSMQMQGPTNGASKLPRAAGPGSAPPVSYQGPPGKLNTAVARVRNTSLERVDQTVSPVSSINQSPLSREVPSGNVETVAQPNGRRTPTGPPSAQQMQQPQPIQQSQPQSQAQPQPQTQPIAAAPSARSIVSRNDSGAREANRTGAPRPSRDNSADAIAKAAATRPASPPPPTRQTSNPLSRRSSGRNSQTVALLKELDSARNRNAWYASELELARKAGFTSNNSLSPILDSRSTETFDDDDKPLIEALLAMRTELANVQSSIDKQAVIAAKQIAEAEKQRDAAIQEAVYAKAKFAAHIGGASSKYQLEEVGDKDERGSDMSRKLATSLHMQKDLQAQLDRAIADVEAERRARTLADDTTNASQKRLAELESYKQQNSHELERLRAELHRAQREAREHAIAGADAVAATQLLRVEKEDMARQLDGHRRTADSGDNLQQLRQALASSTDVRSLLERKLEEEKAAREKAETKLFKLKAEHEARTAELVSTTQRLRDAEELAESHANEARSHRDAVLSGLDQISNRDVNAPNQADAARIEALQGQLGNANAMVRKYQQEVDAAADRLRTAEERIAGLEQYQEQASREGVTIRRQLQSALREVQGHQAANSDLKNQLASQQLETNAITVQHNTLKDILSERGISPTSAPRARGMSSPRDTSPEQSRLRDLEAQLAASHASHEETKRLHAMQQQDNESAYTEKLTQLENDYQSAVHYVKGTEKMLKQLKEQLARYKQENTRLKTEMDDLEEKSGSASGGAAREAALADWEDERSLLQQKVQALQQDLEASSTKLQQQAQNVQQELDMAKRERDTAVKSHEDTSRRLGNSRKDLELLQQENAQLERRAQDAEQKVSLLLDQVETSVDNYRRRSRQVASTGSDVAVQAGVPGLAGANGLGHNRQESSEAESLYGGLGDARNSTALDNLANELETLRSHWETTNKSYRLSNTFDFESHQPTGSAGGAPGASGAGGLGVSSAGRGAGGDGNAAGTGLGLSESLADWRKRLDDGHGE
jgi:hypothetical protein